MTPKSLSEKELRRLVARVERALVKRFGSPEWPGPSDPLESMVVTILSQNTNDVNRDRAWKSLKKAFPTWESVLSAPAAKIARAIRVGGLGNQKSKNIKGFLRWVRKTFGELNLDVMHEMDTDEAVEMFTQLRGIGLKTILVTLAFACGRDVFPVDTHIYRITRRLALVPMKASRDKVAKLMQPLVPKGRSYAFHINLIDFGRSICLARKPLCGECPLRRMCPSADRVQ